VQFWAAYQKVAAEYDSGFLERHDGDMDIVLIFVSRTLNAQLLANGLS
jgi:hypothetical protein